MTRHSFLFDLTAREFVRRWKDAGHDGRRGDGGNHCNLLSRLQSSCAPSGISSSGLMV